MVTGDSREVRHIAIALGRLEVMVAFDVFPKEKKKKSSDEFEGKGRRTREKGELYTLSRKVHCLPISTLAKMFKKRLDECIVWWPTYHVSILSGHVRVNERGLNCCFFCANRHSSQSYNVYT